MISSIPSNPAVQNEPGLSNLRGTFALARIGGQINSGTNNWFINTKDNVFLDTVDEGFTVFGRVVNGGMDVVDAIANLPKQTVRNSIGQTLGNTFPLHGDFTDGVTRDNFVLFPSVEELNVSDGDYDYDGDVDGADFFTWQRGYTSTTDVAADNNGDAVVNATDFFFWVSNYGNVTGGAVAASTSVPEPSSIALVGFAALAALHLASRSTRRP